MALPSSGQITLDSIRREFRVGTTSASNFTDGAIDNASLHGFRGEDYYQNKPPTSGQISMSDYYGLNGESGWFTVGRRGTSPTYLWGWKEYGGGGFYYPEAGDSISAMGSATASTQQRSASYFYVTGILLGEYYDSVDQVNHGLFLKIWGDQYSDSRAPRNLQFKAEYNGATYTVYASNRYFSNPNRDPDSRHSYLSGHRAWVWSGYSQLKTMFDQAYSYSKKIYWRSV